jgi:hypothetical protein
MTKIVFVSSCLLCCLLAFGSAFPNPQTGSTEDGPEDSSSAVPTNMSSNDEESILQKFAQDAFADAESVLLEQVGIYCELISMNVRNWS